MNGPCENTDRVLWRDRGDFHDDTLHVTEEGGIGINCGGTVFVMALRDWHDLASGAIIPAPTPTSGNDEVTDALRLILPLAKGYMAAHPIESNIRYVHTAEAALANVDAHPPVQPTLSEQFIQDALRLAAEFEMADLEAHLRGGKTVQPTESVAQDAARYRWLRDNQDDETLIAAYAYRSDWTPALVDAAIDAAMGTHPPVQPTDWHGDTIGYRDNKATFAGDPPVQPTEPVAYEYEHKDGGAKLAVHVEQEPENLHSSWVKIGDLFRAHPPVQPTDWNEIAQAVIDLFESGSWTPRQQGLWVPVIQRIRAHQPVQLMELPKPELSDALNADTVEAFAKRYAAAVAMQSATPAQPTEPLINGPASASTTTRHVLRTDEPVQPTELPKVYAPCVCSSPESIKLRNDKDGRWSCPRHGHMPKYPPVQPTDERAASIRAKAVALFSDTPANSATAATEKTE